MAGDSIAAGYWNKHEKTKSTFLGEWLETGDSYRVDEDGYYWYGGRSDDLLKVGKANEDDTPTNKKLVDINKEFVGKAPLWYYVLAEAQQQFKNNSTPIHLGPVGGRIVVETFVGLMLGDGHSFLSMDKSWVPNPQRKFMMSDLIKKATAA